MISYLTTTLQQHAFIRRSIQGILLQADNIKKIGSSSHLLFWDCGYTLRGAVCLNFLYTAQLPVTEVLFHDLIRPGLHSPDTPLIWWKFLSRHIKPRILGPQVPLPWLTFKAEVHVVGRGSKLRKPVVATPTQCQLMEGGCHSSKRSAWGGWFYLDQGMEASMPNGIVKKIQISLGRK